MKRIFLFALLLFSVSNFSSPQVKLNFTLFNHHVENGLYYSSGTYIYKLNAGDFTDIKKMILIK